MGHWHAKAIVGTEPTVCGMNFSLHLGVNTWSGKGWGKRGTRVDMDGERKNGSVDDTGWGVWQDRAMGHRNISACCSCRCTEPRQSLSVRQPCSIAESCDGAFDSLYTRPTPTPARTPARQLCACAAHTLPLPHKTPHQNASESHRLDTLYPWFHPKHSNLNCVCA